MLLVPGAKLARKTFDVICLGELVSTVRSGPTSAYGPVRSGASGIVGSALALARRALRVGLVTSFPDDVAGRELHERVRAARIDTSAVTNEPPRSGILLLEGTRSGRGREVVPYRERELLLEVPSEWAASVLLLSGVSPSVSLGASLCRAARAARRAGSTVVLELRARFHAWKGRDARLLHALLSEVDVVRGRIDDLAVLALEEHDLRRRMRDDATLLLEHEGGTMVASSSRGSVVVRRADERAGGSPQGDAIGAELVVDLVRDGRAVLSRGSSWETLAARAAQNA